MDDSRKTYKLVRNEQGRIIDMKWPLRCRFLGFIARLLDVQIKVDGFPLSPLPKRFR